MKVSFGECTLDSASRQLWRAGRELHLTPKAFELLKHLVDQRPRACSKKELHDLLWPDTFVSDVNLAKAVSEVRAAIGDVAEQPRWIRTVHAYGYAFCGEAVSAPGEANHAVHWLVWGRQTLPLTVGENVLGRDPSASVFLDSDRISRRHARIVITGREATIEDLGSKNGTVVCGTPISAPCALAPGDRIQIGPFTLRYRRRDHMSSTKSNTIAAARNARS